MWMINASRGDTICVKSGSRPTLWHRKRALDQSWSLTAAGGATKTFVWPANTEAVLWPNELPLASGDYVLSGPGSVVRTLRLRLLPSQASAPELLAGLAEQGCLAQAERAVSELQS
jgi:hypothetical protein